MGRVFSSKTSKMFRFKVWLTDLFLHLKSLPSYLNPEPLMPSPMSPEEYFALYESEDNKDYIMPKSRKDIEGK